MYGIFTLHLLDFDGKCKENIPSMYGIFTLHMVDFDGRENIPYMVWYLYNNVIPIHMSHTFRRSSSAYVGIPAAGALLVKVCFGVCVPVRCVGSQP